ncbi:alcohol dehydrogenase catalytic domain-containing protein [Symbiopectobacterium sp. RP]|uniref:alcohol dehydrogenase catalytic domain-containing protein n=1 Tax=Symbiopectobacterium sp. RP TaxID=3248553 RepID=UPI003D2B26E7
MDTIAQAIKGHSLGWDASGTVLAIGDRVSGFQVGDEVLALWLFHWRHCAVR